MKLLIFLLFALYTGLSSVPTHYMKFAEIHKFCIKEVRTQHTYNHTFSQMNRFDQKTTFWCTYGTHQNAAPGLFEYYRDRRYDACVVKCIAENMGIYKNDQFDVDAVLHELVSDGLRDVVKVKVVRCIKDNHSNSTDKCNEVYDTVNCYYTDQCHGNVKIIKPTMLPTREYKIIDGYTKCGISYVFKNSWQKPIS